jgi:hypothetical protein
MYFYEHIMNLRFYKRKKFLKCQLKTVYCGLQKFYIHLAYYLDIQLIDAKITWFLTEQVVDFISFS